MTKKEFQKEYNKLWNQALSLPKKEVLIKLKEMKDLKTKFYSQNGK